MINEETPPVVHETVVSTNEQPPSADKYSLQIDDEGVVVATNFSSVVPEDFIEVSSEIWLEAQQHVGEYVWVDGELTAIGDEEVVPVTTK